MRYSIEAVEAERRPRRSVPAIVLEAHPDAWVPAQGQVELPRDEVDPQTLPWGRIEYEPNRLGADYDRLQSLLVRGATGRFSPRAYRDEDSLALFGRPAALPVSGVLHPSVS